MEHSRNPKATLWLFAYQGLTAATHMSIVQELMTWPNLSHHVKAGDADIGKARSRTASWFLAEPESEAGSVLLMVDSDTAWQAGDLSMIARRALEHTAVVGGIYSKREFGQGDAFRVADEADGVFVIGEDSLIPAAAVGGGFMAIPRSILEAVAKTLPTVKDDFVPCFMPFVTSDMEYATEDWAFCFRAREAGFKVFASTYPKLTHEGTYTYRLVDGRARPPQDRTVTFNFDAEARAAQINGTQPKESVHAS